MTKSEFIEVYRREYGYEPCGHELELLMDEYRVDDDPEEEYTPPPQQRQQSRVYQFSRNRYNDSSNVVDELFTEVKNIINGIAGSAKHSRNKGDESGLMAEFGYMAIVFLLKSGIYFALKVAYSKGFDSVNL